MKKRLALIVTMLLVLVMSFALMACDNPDGPGGVKRPPTKEEIAEKAVSSLAEYLGAAEQQGRIDYALDTENTEKVNGYIEFVKNGSMFFYKSGDDGAENMLDLDTGMSYVKTDAGWVVKNSLIPQNAAEYALDVIMNSDVDLDVDFEFNLDEMTYDAKARAFSHSTDVAQNINRVLSPLQETYDGEGSLRNLIDAYLAEYNREITDAVPFLKLLGTSLTVKNIAPALRLLIVSAKDEKLIDFIGANFGEELEDAIYDLLNAMDVGPGSAAMKKAKARTIGEAAEGLLAYIADKIDLAAIANGDYSSVTSIIMPLINGTDEERFAVLSELVDYLLLSDVDTSNLDNDLKGLFDTIIDLMSGIKIKPLIDGLTELEIPGMSAMAELALGIVTPVVKTIVAEPVTFKKLGGATTVKLMPDYTVESITVEFNASHDYNKQTALPFLSDNDYYASFTITPTGSSADAKAELEFAPFDGENTEVLHTYASAIVRLDSDAPVYVYLETRMLKRVSVGSFTSVCHYSDGGTDAIYDIGMSFDEKTSSFVLDTKQFKKSVSEMFEYGEVVSVTVSAIVTVGGGDSYQALVALYIVPDAQPETAAGLLANMLAALRA
ncbi:MAG: hypothetical protein J1G38_00590 [Clostridiales bacterium]|nr:hypothetical protein [Clostridiales bacterium]